ncbi:hypothetical protein ACQ7CX_11385 [Chryseobacterium arthrosphaerae]|uniref:hypothetical protein n=1 Tax=Chryseobacterium arthrosphaerae TaxID=651561 RepID=UPI001BAE9314|nr:hypothetical protein [Chryseobacterium arthrosphaerae]QUY54039.1 hypothetical protein I2F65_14225 [Chryseobacterium arthrosphaerae]
MSSIAEYEISFGVQEIHGKDYKFMKSNEFILSNLMSEYSTMRKSDELVEAITYAQEHPQDGSIRFKMGCSSWKYFHQLQKSILIRMLIMIRIQYLILLCQQMISKRSHGHGEISSVMEKDH